MIMVCPLSSEGLWVPGRALVVRIVLQHKLVRADSGVDFYQSTSDVASWFASCQLGFLTCYVRFDYYLFPVISEWNACKLVLGI